MVIFGQKTLVVFCLVIIFIRKLTILTFVCQFGQYLGLARKKNDFDRANPNHTWPYLFGHFHDHFCSKKDIFDLIWSFFTIFQIIFCHFFIRKLTIFFLEIVIHHKERGWSIVTNQNKKRNTRFSSKTRTHLLTDSNSFLDKPTTIFVSIFIKIENFSSKTKIFKIEKKNQNRIKFKIEKNSKFRNPEKSTIEITIEFFSNLKLLHRKRKKS